jgi:hypothetical protein
MVLFKKRVVKIESLALVSLDHVGIHLCTIIIELLVNVVLVVDPLLTIDLVLSFEPL